MIPLLQNFRNQKDSLYIKRFFDPPSKFVFGMENA